MSFHPHDTGVYFHPTNLGVYSRSQAAASPGFWRRQFSDSTTPDQLYFDVAFGVVVPVLCFVFDPVVFHDWMSRDSGLYGGVRLFAYAASAIEMATLACWLLVIPRRPALSRPAGGVMLAGAFFSFAIGLAILPFSVIGIAIAGLGLLGFIPFLTALVYMRNGLRALRLNRTASPVRGAAWASFLFGLLLALALPAAAQRCSSYAIQSAFRDALAGDAVSAPRRRAVRLLWKVSGAGLEGAAREYRWGAVNGGVDEGRRARLAEAYREVTGDDINRRQGSAFLFDGD